MAFQITDSTDLAEFDRLWNIARDAMGPSRQNPQIGLFAELYNLVADITTETFVVPGPSNPTGEVTSSPRPGVSINSWLWIAGAKTVNNNEGFNGQFIQKFTQQQYFQRNDETLSDAKAQIASNNVAFNFFEDIAIRIRDDAANHIPTMAEIAVHDAGAAAKQVFNELPGGGEFAPWAGTLLFPYLGYDPVFKEWLITNKKVEDDVENNQGVTETLTFSVVEGTYNLFSTIQAARKAGLDAGLSNWREAIATLITTQFGGAPAGALDGDQSDLIDETNEYFWRTYGLSEGETPFTPGSRLPFGSASQQLGERYKVGTLKDDANLTLNDGSVAFSGGLGKDWFRFEIGANDTGTDLIDGGAGSDTVFYNNFRDSVTVTLESLDAVPDQQNFTRRMVVSHNQQPLSPGAPVFFSDDLLYSVENLVLTDHDDTFTVKDIKATEFEDPYTDEETERWTIIGGDGIDTIDFSMVPEGDYDRSLLDSKDGKFTFNDTDFWSFERVIDSDTSGIIFDSEKYSEKVKDLSELQQLKISDDTKKLITAWNLVHGEKYVSLLQIEGGDGDDVLVGTSANDDLGEAPASVPEEAEREQSKAAIKLSGDDGADVLFALLPEVVELEDGSKDFAIVSGGAGNDWVLTAGGQGAYTIGGPGRDWIFNTSKNGHIFGDTIDGILLREGEQPRSFAEHNALDTSANSDNIWWWPSVTMWDPGKTDVLKLFGMPLVGGNNQLPILGFLGSLGFGISGLESLQAARSLIFYDYFMPFITYKIDPENNRLLVGNIFSKLFGFFSAEGAGDNNLPGVMAFNNFDEASAVFWGGAFYKPSEEGSFAGLFSYTNELNTDLIGDMGMIFKITHPVFGIYAMIPGFPGGLNRFLPLIDQILTFAGAATLLGKATQWSEGTDPLIIDLDGDGIETTSIEEGVFFDIDGDFFREQVSWLGSDDGFLALDLNANGIIDDITELFGQGDVSGFTELAAYDGNADGVIDAADLVFGDLSVWRDLDQDGETDAGELFSVEEVGIVSITLGGNDLDVTTPQGVQITQSGDVTFADGRIGNAFDAIFEANDTETRYRGEAGVPAWLKDTVIDSRGFGEIADYSIAMSNDFDIMELALNASASMTTANLKLLREQAGDALGQWGYGLSVTRELTPVLTQTVNGVTTLVDRAVWVEDGDGGYWTLHSGADVTDAQGAVIARPTLSDIMVQTAGADQVWTMEQMWSPSGRTTALEHREAAPYLGTMEDGRFVISDYGIQQADGSWQLASGTPVLDAQSGIIAHPTAADITAMAAPEGHQWRIETFGHNDLSGITTKEIGVNFIDGVAVDYTVELTDRDGTFHVWARNLDRALELQDKFGTPRDFNLRNYEIDFDTLDEVGSSDESTYRVEVMTPAQFNFATSLIGLEFEPAVLAGTIDDATGFIDYSIDGEEPAWQADETRPGSIDAMIDLLDVVMEQWILVSRAFAARMAFQGGLSSFAVDLEYDIETDAYTSTGDRELAPMFEAILEAAPEGYDAQQQYLRDWNEVLWQIYPDYKLDGEANFFGGTVAIDQKFLMQMIIPAYEKFPLEVDLLAILNALGVNEELLVQHDAADTEVLGDSGVNFIYLSGGDQIYKGGDGADVYFVGADWGTDFIEDVDFGAADELRFTSVKSDEIIATRDGQDLILMKDGSPDVLRVENHFLGELNPAFGNDSEDTRMTSIVFADGVVWGRVEIAIAVSRPLDSDQVIVGSGDLDVLDGGLGNDVLRGGAGGDMYMFARGYGQDVISEDNSAASNPLVAGIDFLQFMGDDLTADDLYLKRFGESGDLHITLKDADGNLTNDNITLEGQFDGLRLNLTGFLAENVDDKLELDYIAPNLIERFLFEDGSSLDFNEMGNRVLETAKTDGSDVIYGFLNANLLDGGAGDDLLVGREGGDTYVFGRDYGLDEIVDGDNSVKLFGAPDDILNFTDDLRWTDFDFLRDGDTDNLTLQVSGTTDGVVLTEYLKVYPFLGFINLIEQINFGDGTNWHYTQLLQHYINIAKTDGDDAVYGFMTSDTLDGGLGDDTLEGQGGNDTYILRAGDGNDRIFDAGGSADKVQMQGIALADVDFSRTGLDLIVTHRTTGEVITFAGQYLRAGAQGAAIETFEFSDLVISFTQINPDDIDRIGTTGDDSLEGSNFAEILDGQAGNDTLVGGSDGDTYRFGIGYGEDVIIDTQVAAAWKGRTGIEVETGDRIAFGADVTRDMVVFAKDGEDLLITLAGFPDTLRVRNQFRDVTDGVEFFDFANDPTLLISDVEEFLQITGGNRGDNRIEGIADQENVLDGRQGDDTLVGGSLGDTYSFGIDYDFDRIEEVADASGIIDRVVMGQGVRAEDLILRRDGDDLLIDLGNGADVLRIVNGLTTNTIEEFLFTGDVTLTLADIRAQMLLGSDRNDQLIGFDQSDDLLDGGAGSDALIGGTGDDIYRFGYGGGQDEVIDTGGIDTLEFGVGIAPGNLRFSEANGDLLIELRGTDASIVVIDGLRDGAVIDRFVFEGGTVLGMADIRGQLFNATATGGTNVFDGTTLDPIWSIAPGVGADKVIMGPDTRVVFERGDGMDVYVLQDAPVGDAMVEFVDLASTDVAVRSVGRLGRDLALDFPESGDQVILAGAQIRDETPVIRFADGIEWTKDDLTRAAVTAQAGATADVITGSALDDTISASTGDDDVQGGAGNDTYVFTRGDGQDYIADSAGTADVLEISGYVPDEITVSRPDPTREELVIAFADTDDLITLLYDEGAGIDMLRFSDGTTLTKDQMFVLTVAQGTQFADTLVGSDTDDVLNGLGGDDRLEGTLGDDLYVVDFAEGDDVIVDTGGIDRLLLREALPGQVVVSRTRDDLRIDLPGAGSVTVLGYMSNADSRIEEIEFSDGTSWNFAAVSLIADQTARATGGTIYGGQEFNTYVFTKGDGSYAIEDQDSYFQLSGRLDRLEFRDTALDEVTFVRVGTDIELRINNGETLTLRNFYARDDYEIETIQFTDGTLELAEIFARVVADAKSTGFVLGSEAFETYTHSTGDGSYTIEDRDTFFQSSGRQDKLVFTDVTSAQVTFAHVDDNIELRLDYGEVVTLSKFYAGDDYEIETIEFTDLTLGLGEIYNRVVSDAKASGFVEGGRAFETYVHSLGDGSYTIEDLDSFYLASGRLDKLVFTDVARADVQVQINGNDVIFVLPNDERVTISRGAERNYAIETIEFMGGDSVSSTAAWETAFTTGTSFDDTLTGRNAADSYQGLAGDDTIDGGRGNDTLDGGAGDDLLLEGDGIDVFQGGAGIDTLDFRAERDDITFDLGAQVITLENGTTEVASGIEVVLAGSGDDLLRGDSGANTLDGGTGNDTLEGADGDDLYVIRDLARSVTVSDVGAASTADQILLEGALFGASMLVQNGDDLVINFAAGGSLTVSGQLGADADHRVESIVWADGPALDVAGIAARVAQGYATTTGFVEGTSGADAFVHAAGDGFYTLRDVNGAAVDTLTLAGFNSDQVAFGRVGDDLLLQLDNDETIRIFDQFDTRNTVGIETIIFEGGTLDQGAFFARLLEDSKATGAVVGSSAQETYVHTQGDGSYSILDQDIARNDIDRLEFASTLSAQAQFLHQGDDLVIALDNGEQITIRKYFGTSTWYRIEQIVFDDETLDLAAIRLRTVADMKALGAVIGSHLTDTYFHTRDDGSYSIFDQDIGRDDIDRLAFTDISAAEANFANVGTDLVITLDNGEQITLRGQSDTSQWYRIEEIVFTDTTLDRAAIRARAVADAKANGAIQGTFEQETYHHAQGDGSYSILDQDVGRNDIDVLSFSDTNSADAFFAREGENLIITLSNGEVITIREQFDTSQWYRIETITFADGAQVLHADLDVRIAQDMARVRNLVEGTENQDMLSGTSAADLMVGLIGDDILSGGLGDDTYQFTKGDGHDVIADAGDGIDRIEIIGFAIEDIRFDRDGRGGDDLVVTLGDAGDRITITNGMLSDAANQIEAFHIAQADATLSIADILAQITRGVTTEGADDITGTNAANVLEGGTGNDRLEGLRGQDDYVFGTGDGDDRISDNAYDANDRLVLTDYNVADVVWVARTGANGTDMVIKFAGERDRVTLEDVLGSSALGVDTIVFADGTEWGRDAMRAITVLSAQTVSDDLVVGFDGDDVLAGGPGNDRLQGGEGADVYEISRGNGFDEVLDGGTDGDDVDRIEFAHYVSSEVSVRRLFKGSDTVVLTFVTSNDTLTVFNALATDGTAIEELVFSDGVIWTPADLLAKIDNTAPEAVADGYFSATQNSPLTIGAEELLRNDFDPDGQDLTIIAVDGGADGVAELDANGNVVFTGNEGFFGVTKLTYTISDGQNGIASTTVDLRVRPQAEARDDSGFEVNEDGSITIRAERLLSNDLDGDRMIVGEVFDPVNGMVSLASNGDITFTPTADFNGLARFTYAANTPEGGRAEALVTLNVTAQNDAPEAADDSGFETVEDQPFQIFTGTLLANDVDIDGDRLSIVDVQSNVDVTVTLTDDGYVLVNPAAFFWGNGHFDYTVQDADGARSTARVDFYVAPVNNVPEPAADSFTTQEDDPILIDVADLLANDVERDGDTLEVTGVFSAINGRVNLQNNGTVLFTPSGDFNGPAGFSYRVDDGQGGVATAQVTIDVTSVNDDPNARDDFYVGFVPTKVRKVPHDLLHWSVLPSFLLFLHLLFSRRFYAALFGGRMPRVSRSFSSEKSYSPSMLM